MLNGRTLSNKGASRAFPTYRQMFYLAMMKVVIVKMVWNTKTFEFKQSEEVSANPFFLKKLWCQVTSNFIALNLGLILFVEVACLV
jgi:hypothetical protein